MDQKKIGKYIADKRKELGMTQVSLADKLDVSDKSVSKWERGVCLPDVSKYQELCDTLGISLNELFAGEDLPVENVIKQSERNLIWISRLGEVKNKRLFRIIIALIMCVIVLTAGFIWNMNQDKTLRGNYITAFSIENPDEAGLVFTFGDAAIFNYSLDESFKNVTYEIVHDYLKVVGTPGNESILVLKKDLIAGQVVEVDVEYIGNNLTYAVDNAITFITYPANESGHAINHRTEI